MLAIDNPIKSVLFAGGGLGFGLQFDQMEQGLACRIELQLAVDELDGRERKYCTWATLFSPLGIGLGAEGHASFFHTDLSLQLNLGSGRRDDLAARCSQNVELTTFELEGFAGADVLDIGEYDPELDLVLGLGGGFLSYSESQVNLNNGPGCSDIPPQGIDIGDARLFGRAQFAHTSGFIPKLRFFVRSDFNFVGGLNPMVPLIYDDKLAVLPTSPNADFRLGINLLFSTLAVENYEREINRYIINPTQMISRLRRPASPIWEPDLHPRLAVGGRPSGQVCPGLVRCLVRPAGFLVKFREWIC